MHRQRPALARLPIGLLVKLIELVENNQNVRYEEGEEYFVYTTIGCVSTHTIDKYKRELHLEIENGINIRGIIIGLLNICRAVKFNVDRRKN